MTLDSKDIKAGEAWFEKYVDLKARLDVPGWVALFTPDSTFFFGGILFKNRDDLDEKVGALMGALTVLKYHDYEVTVLPDKTLVSTAITYHFKKKDLPPVTVKAFCVFHKKPTDETCHKGEIYGDFTQLHASVKKTVESGA